MHLPLVTSVDVTGGGRTHLPAPRDKMLRLLRVANVVISRR